MQKQKRILLCPLDWGLGHATRCIPIIRLLLQKNAEIIIAADGRPMELLKQEFPNLEFVRLKGYNINYPTQGSMVWKMFLSIPKILKGIREEHNALQKIIQEKKIDIVISDNRFGLWNKQIKSVFITHQLMIKAPFGEKLLHLINLYYIKKYDHCWVPDVEKENNLSGDLSHKYKLPANAKFIGPLSRFERNSTPKENYQYDVMAIISGPEPQRSIFEKIISEQAIKSKLKVLIVLGTPEKTKTEERGAVKIVSHLHTYEMQQAIGNTAIVIARSGYSTIMDLAVLGKKAIFVTTPGQTEQEYLAEDLMQKKIAYYQKQSEFNLLNALKEAKHYKGFDSWGTMNNLKNTCESILLD